MSKRKKIPEGLFEAEIERLTHEGRGVAVIDGKTTFIDGALPGERVEFSYLRVHSRYNEGKVENVLKASADRVPAKCPHFGVCGGCSLQHVSEEAQIRLKQAQLKEQFEHFGQVAPQTWLQPISGPQWGYRRKARLAVKSVFKKNKVLVGFREKNGRYVADIDGCDVLDTRVASLLPKLSLLVESLTINTQVPQIEVSCGDELVSLIVRHLEPLTAVDQAALSAFAKDEEVQIYLQSKGPDTVRPLYPQQPKTLHYTLPEFDLKLQFEPLDFVQVNGAINQALVSHAVELLAPTEDDNILDLFCGLGNFSLAIAKYARGVVGVEFANAMVLQAKDNALRNGLKNTAFFAADLTQTVTDKVWFNEHYTKVLIDPPRTGALEVIEQVGRLNSVKRIVYVSCNPATLARDAGKLVNEYGFELKKAGVVNMFPHTAHIESIAVFER